ncbi:MAG: hypothetical protein ACUVR4_11385 [Anaerolineae bacterium]
MGQNLGHQGCIDLAFKLRQHIGGQLPIHSLVAAQLKTLHACPTVANIEILARFPEKVWELDKRN